MKITPKTLKNGKTSYYYEFVLFNERRHRTCKGCSTYAEAQEHVAREMKKIADVKRGLIDESKVITIKEMFDLLKTYTTNNNSQGHASNQIRDAERFIEFFGADTVIADITPEIIENYRVKRLKQNVSKNTVNHDISTLSKAFNDIIINRRLQLFNPCRAVKDYKVDPAPIRICSVEEWKALQKELAPHLKYICLFLVQTGLRPLQVYNLQWERLHMDTEYPFIEILPNDKGNKSKKYYRVPISNVLHSTIKKLGIKEKGYIFLNPKNNKPYSDIRTGFNAACRRAGIKEHLVPYDLKNTVGTTMASNRVPCVAIQQVFNHSSMQISEKYITSISQDVINAVEVMKDYD